MSNNVYTIIKVFEDT